MKITANLETMRTTQANAGNVYVCHWKQDIEGKTTEGWREWAIFVVNDELGLLSIVSPFGNWSHCWAPRHLSAPTLHHFLGRRMDVDYVMGKLATHDEWYAVSFEETKKSLIRELLESRRGGYPSKEKARARYDELVAWEESDDTGYARDEWDWPDWIQDRWERVQEAPTAKAEAFRLQIWPVLQKCIRDELARREQIADVVP